MNAKDIARRRLHSQRIASPAAGVAEVVAGLGAVQAQDYLGALWSVGLRAEGATEADVERAIADRAIVRTWPMRGTLHLVASADVRWMLALLTPRVIARAGPRYKQLELTDADFKKARRLFEKALAGGKHLAREAMYEVMERGGVSAEGQRGIHVLSRLSMEGLLCFAPRQGKQPAFALLEEWVPKARPLAREEALGELALRYFTGHGPATLPDFMWWTGLTAADAKQALALAGPALERLELGGVAYWAGPGAAPAGAAGLHLLPGFDEYLIAYKDRSASLAGEHAERLHPGGNGMFLPSIVRDGRVVGTWRRTLKKGRVEVEPSPFEPLGKADARALEAEAGRYGRFLGLAAALGERRGRPATAS